MYDRELGTRSRGLGSFFTLDRHQIGDCGNETETHTSQGCTRANIERPVSWTRPFDHGEVVLDERRAVRSIEAQGRGSGGGGGGGGLVASRERRDLAKRAPPSHLYPNDRCESIQADFRVLNFEPESGRTKGVSRRVRDDRRSSRARAFASRLVVHPPNIPETREKPNKRLRGTPRSRGPRRERI